jgi:hypothetical protein
MAVIPIHVRIVFLSNMKCYCWGYEEVQNPESFERVEDAAVFSRIISPLECLRIKLRCPKSRHPVTDYCTRFTTHVVTTPSAIIRSRSQLMGCLVRLLLRMPQVHSYVCELLITFDYHHSSHWGCALYWTSGQVKTGLCQAGNPMAGSSMFDWIAFRLCIWEAPDWNPDTETGYPSWWSCCPCRQTLGYRLKLAAATCSSTSFPIHISLTLARDAAYTKLLTTWANEQWK